MYFLSAYSQYKTLGKLIGHKDELKSCPSFHNLLVNYDVKASQLEQYSLNVDFTEVKSDKTMASLYPILAVPYSKSQDLYTALENDNWENSNDHLKNALTHYFETTTREVEELCEKGVGSGYYVYENLVTYFKKDNSFHKTQNGLKALLKVPVLANMIILDNLNTKDSTLKSDNIYDKWLLSRTNAEWFETFLNQLKDKRKSKISSNLMNSI